MCDQQRLRPACAYAQSDQSLCRSLEYSMSVKLLTGVSNLKRSLQRLFRFYACQNATLLEISCTGSNHNCVLPYSAGKVFNDEFYEYMEKYKKSMFTLCKQFNIAKKGFDNCLMSNNRFFSRLFKYF